MEIFTGATDVNVNNSHFSNVGDQYIGCTINHHPARTRGRREIRENLPRLEEFNEVKQGNIIKYKDIGEPWLLYPSGETVEEAVYSAKIISFGTEVFTVKAYSGGRKARKRWRRDFLKCSIDWRRDIPLFGYSKSSVPLLIFHGELIPIAHVEKGLEVFGKFYIELLRKTLGCLRNELWMDPTKGKFCLGPPGPKCEDWDEDYRGVTIPSDVEFLKEDVIIRYLLSIKDDEALFCALGCSSQIELAKEVAYPHIVSSSTSSIIAFNRNVRWRSWKGCLGWKGRMSDGMTRFCLNDDQCFIDIRSDSEIPSWLAQALSVFNTHGIESDEDLSDYKFIYPCFKLTGSLQRSKCKQQRRQLWKPIYLFFLPSPSPTRHFYFWSHDSLGRIPLSRDRCKYLGLPFKLSIELDYLCESWSTSAYKIIHEHQIAKGFNPITTDFAQFQGFPIFEVAPPEKRFQEVEEEGFQIRGSMNASTSLTSSIQPADLTQQPGMMQSLLSALISPFNSEEVEKLGISAVAI